MTEPTPINQNLKNADQQPDIQTEARARKDEAEMHWEAITGAAPLASRSSLVIGWHAFRMKERNLFGMLGFGTEEEARKAADVGESTWYSTIAIARSFEGLPKELFCGMRLTNAKAMTDLPESKRLDHEWVALATTDSIENFQKRVEEALFGKAKPSDSKERTATMKLTMPASQKKVIEEKIQAFAEHHDIDPQDQGKIIEAAMLEATDGDSLIGAMAACIQRCKKVKDLAESGLSSDEIIEQVLRLNEETILDFARVMGARTEEAAA